MDLVDIYLENNPSLCLVMDTIPTLFALLEYCIKDNLQRPLEIRVRSALKKISQIKKINDTETVDDELIAMVLKVLMDKGVRSKCTYLSYDMNTFLILADDFCNSYARVFGHKYSYNTVLHIPC